MDRSEETSTSHTARTITKKDLIDGLTRSMVKVVVHALFAKLVDEVGDGNRLEFRDFGVFEVRPRAARTAQNPWTLERVPVPPKYSVKFKPGRKMKIALEELAKLHPVEREIEVKPESQPAAAKD